MTHPILGCKVYISYRRSVGRLLCGWAALNAISNSHTDNGESIPDEHPEAQSLITVVKDFEGLGIFFFFSLFLFLFFLLLLFFISKVLKL